MRKVAQAHASLRGPEGLSLFYKGRRRMSFLCFYKGRGRMSFLCFTKGEDGGGSSILQKERTNGLSQLYKGRGRMGFLCFTGGPKGMKTEYLTKGVSLKRGGGEEEKKFAPPYKILLKRPWLKTSTLNCGANSLSILLFF